ncbi:MAG: hypothetical protein SWK76_02165 [Actinomycetota bacterium]|nr:hypothetical protein [Actinomycetota bacterium]
MNERKRNIEEKLATVNLNIDKEPHIVARKELCREWLGKPCLAACPAANYEWDEMSRTSSSSTVRAASSAAPTALSAPWMP